ncbi:ABC transporter permease [Methylobacterium nonmethylotrophicum]|uniref:ABC transporter permease n=1 Tax=Methylobacterium nonmethylotrophicum TaxID=1141884 RepID=A0A4Z0NUR7_9HYPH|nr:ABC transporter permease [Methylobacterium nonmethylotrophicum]TGE00315.1 ABC transporter permease [Methylobacterium nonmethylotrophicum]
MSGLRQRLVALALVLPLLLFLGVFFAWPLVTMSAEAIPQSVVARGLPRTAAAAAAWDRTTPPTEAMREALVADLRAAPDDQALAGVVQTLNSAKSGYRTLIARTVAALRGGEGPADLAAIDRRWADPAFWRPIAAETANTRPDANLLAALDLRRDEDGTIRSLPEGASANRRILVRTFVIAGLVTLACLLIGLPYAMLMASLEGWRRQVLLAAVLLPLWTSLLVRTAAWFILLQDNGPVNGLLRAVGIGALPLIFNRTGVVVAMTHVLLPFMVLPIYSVLLGIPRNLMQAAGSMGAHPIRAFVEVLLPLSARGIVAGALLVFMAAIGYYITPALIGGPQDQMISSIIAFYALQTANWGMASALGLVLLAITIVLYAVYHRLSVDEPGRA